MINWAGLWKMPFVVVEVKAEIGKQCNSALEGFVMDDSLVRQECV